MQAAPVLCTLHALTVAPHPPRLGQSSFAAHRHAPSLQLVRLTFNNAGCCKLCVPPNLHMLLQQMDFGIDQQLWRTSRWTVALISSSYGGCAEHRNAFQQSQLLILICMSHCAALIS